MPISQSGEINTTALVVPDIYVQVVPPTVSLLNGVPTNVLGVVGTATWGPVDSPVTVSSMAEYAETFGPIQAPSGAAGDKFDLGIGVATAVMQGANNFRCVRVTNGTAVKANVTWNDGSGNNHVKFVSKYGGTHGNKTKIVVSKSSNFVTTSAENYRIDISIPGRTTEVFDNIAKGANAAGTRQNIIDAIMLGQSGIRGPSQIVTAEAPASSLATADPAYTTSAIELASGTDGSAVTSSGTLVGTAAAGNGLHALSGTGCSVAFCTGADDAAQWATQVAFGKAEGCYVILTQPDGGTVAAQKTAAEGTDSYVAKLMFGDWVVWMDNANNKTRTVTPQGFVAGRLANLSPEQSSLNKPLYGVVSTTRLASNQPFSDAELQSIAESRMDLITTPSPGGQYYSTRLGHNTSSNPVINTDGYTRMTNYIATTLEAGMGVFVGQLQTPTVRRSAKATLESFLAAMEGQGMIGSADGSSPFQVVLDDTNNPQSRVALGYMQADVKVRYLSVVEKLLVNVEGGQSVEIQRVETAPAV